MADNINQIISVDLPINEVTGYLEGLLQDLGEDCLVDNVPAKIMVSDLQRAYDTIQENSKQAVVSKQVKVNKGSKIDFASGRKGIVYTVPQDDIVSYSMRVLMCNSNISVRRYEEVYDATTGDILSQGEQEKPSLDGFIERLTAREKQFDIGLLKEAILRFTTYVGADIELEDIVTFKGKRYKVIDIDDITEGLLVIQLASMRK